MAWTLWECVASARKACARRDGTFTPFTLANVEDEGGFCWAVTSCEAYMGITDEDVIARFGADGNELGRDFMADHRVVMGDPDYPIGE